MSDPYATPNSPGATPPQRKSRWRVLKHAVAFVVIVMFVNFDRFFVSPQADPELPQVSFTASVITLLLFYGLGYAVISRVRSRR